MPSLTLALLHATAEHKQPDSNRAQLLSLMHQAGEAGAQLALSPELAISGYSFANRDDIAPFTETVDGPTISALRPLARRYGMYICVGLAEREPRSNLFYNSVFVLDAQGQLICRYRKMNAEIRWACPGNPREDNTFATPWGRIGLLICSDSYHSLPARVTARRGAKLILIPANWPPTGLDPREIWQARALENGVTVAICNRTGMDLSMDCRQGPSAVFGADGERLLDHCSNQTCLLLTELPLDDQGHLVGNRMQDRSNLGDCTACALPLSSIADLTSFLRLPPPGHLVIHCLATSSMEQMITMLQPGNQGNAANLYLLPAAAYSDSALELLQRYCDAEDVALCCTRLEQHPGICWLQGKQPPRILELSTWAQSTSLPWVDYGPARILPIAPQVLHHPEPICAAAKQGCDLVACSAPAFSANDRLIAGARTIDNVTTAHCSDEGGGIWLTPEGHGRWQEILAAPQGACSHVLDTQHTRHKKFQDRVDYQQLLASD